MKKYSRCKDCGTEDPSLLYRSGRMSRCHDCQHYENLITKQTGGGVQFTREEFLAWRRRDQSHRRCAYCGIGGHQLIRLAIVNVRNKKPYEVIGVDRMDNSAPYRLDNIIACCGPCNAIKGSILTDTEMRAIGPAIGQLWEARLRSSEQ